uniref:dihydrofolate reductase n=1 Tax=viral metagenome TaxID=1070528 RepID=A0A6C0I2S4_9ZZZZ
MNINIAVAFSKNYGIGFKNNLPWSHLKEDMRLFSKRTIGAGNNAVIMGKNTWFSIPENRRPLKNRTNIVISSSLSLPSSSPSLDGNPQIFSSIHDAMSFCECESAKYHELWVIGGSQMYSEFLNTYYNKLNRVYITYVCGDYECDTFIHFSAADYCVEKEEHNTEERCHYLTCIHIHHPDNNNKKYDTLETTLKNFCYL